MFILLINCPFDDAKVRQFWEVGKSFADFCPKLWRHHQGSATKWREAAESCRKRGADNDLPAPLKY